VDNRPVSTLRTDADEEREAARPDVRLFVILLDDYHVRRGNDMAVRKPLTEFIETQLDPADMVAVMYARDRHPVHAQPQRAHRSHLPIRGAQVRLPAA
jgi:hypothetical protein